MFGRETKSEPSESLQIIQTKFHRRLAWRYAVLRVLLSADPSRPIHCPTETGGGKFWLCGGGGAPSLFAFACEVDDRYRVLNATPRISAVACTDTKSAAIPGVAVPVGALPLFCFRRGLIVRQCCSELLLFLPPTNQRPSFGSFKKKVVYAQPQ